MLKSTLQPSVATSTASLPNASTSAQQSGKTGNIVIKPQFISASKFSEGLAFLEGNESGYIDKTGRIVKPQYEDEEFYE